MQYIRTISLQWVCKIGLQFLGHSKGVKKTQKKHSSFNPSGNPLFLIQGGLSFFFFLVLNFPDFAKSAYN